MTDEWVLLGDEKERYIDLQSYVQWQDGQLGLGLSGLLAVPRERYICQKNLNVKHHVTVIYYSYQ